MFVAVLSGTVVGPSVATGKSCVWKVTAPGGQTLFLAGSAHAMRSTDYPLPLAFNRAFELSQCVAMEIDLNAGQTINEKIEQAGRYPSGDSLARHIDPRTYAYLQRAAGKYPGGMEKLLRLRPWYISIQLEGSGGQGFSHRLGLESYFSGRARATARPVYGLESLNEHVLVFSGLNDRESEAQLLVSFIGLNKEDEYARKTMQAWHAGDIDTLYRLTRESYRDFPSMFERLVPARNRAWIARIEGWIKSGRTYFVMPGAAHLGGPDGVLALLRARGYTIEQW